MKSVRGRSRAEESAALRCPPTVGTVDSSIEETRVTGCLRCSARTECFQIGSACVSNCFAFLSFLFSIAIFHFQLPFNCSYFTFHFQFAHLLREFYFDLLFCLLTFLFVVALVVVVAIAVIVVFVFSSYCCCCLKLFNAGTTNGASNFAVRESASLSCLCCCCCCWCG